MDAVALAAIVGGIVAPPSLLLNWLQFRHAARRDQRTDKALEEFTKIARSYEAEVGILRQELEALKARSPLAGAAAKGLVTSRLTHEELRAQKLALEARREARREREAAWKRLRDLGRGARWLLGDE